METIVMRIGLTFDEYVELRLNPPAGGDPAFQTAADQEREQMFPTNLASAANHLRARGYDCKPLMLEMLIENGVVKPAGRDVWAQADVDAAAQHFEDAQIFVPYAAMCQAFGCRYADFLRPLREAAERASREYKRHVPEDDQYFVMHRVPSRGVTDDNGNLIGVEPAKVSFTLSDDVKERLERGEEV